MLRKTSSARLAAPFRKRGYIEAGVDDDDPCRHAGEPDQEGPAYRLSQQYRPANHAEYGGQEDKAVELGR